MSADMFLALPARLVPPEGVRLSIIPRPRDPRWEFWPGILEVADPASDIVLIGDGRHGRLQKLVKQFAVDGDDNVERLILDEEVGGTLLSQLRHLVDDTEAELQARLDSYQEMLADEDPYWQKAGRESLESFERSAELSREAARTRQIDIEKFLRHAAGREVVVAYL